MEIEQNHGKLHRDRPAAVLRRGRLGLIALSCLGMVTIAPIARAEETIPFGAPLPGTPIAPVPEAGPQEEPQPAPAPIEVEVLEAPRPPAPSATGSTTEDSGWVVEEGAGNAVTVVQEPAAATAIAPPEAAPSSFFEPVVPSQGRYVVYALGDNLGLFEQVKQLSPTAAFVTYRGQTAVRAGVFERSIDATARVRELTQRGIAAEIGDLTEASGTPSRAIAPRNARNGRLPGQAVASRPGSSDPSFLFANFEATPPAMGATPLPVAGRGLPPLGNTSRSRSLPEPPPAPIADEAWNSGPQEPPIAPPAPTFRTAALTPPGTSDNTATTSEAYFVVVAGDPASLPQLVNQLSELGVPASSVFPNESGGLRIGPFASRAMAEQWQARLRSARLNAELMQNGWIVDDRNR